MAEQKKSRRSHVCGFIRSPKRHDGQIFFRIEKEKFQIPEKSTFGEMVTAAHQKRENILVLFEYQEKMTGLPRIEGVVIQPVWPEVKAAGDGATFDEVRMKGEEHRQKKLQKRFPSKK